MFILCRRTFDDSSLSPTKRVVENKKKFLSSEISIIRTLGRSIKEFHNCG